METLHAAIGLYPHTRALHNGATALGDQAQLVTETLAGAGGFGHLLEDQHFDVFEMPIVSLVVAQQQGIAVVGAPLVMTRRFHHSRLVWNRSIGITEPSDLAHRKAGLRYHGFTDAAWARGILSDDFGLDPGEVTWVTSTPETVPDAPLPPNVIYTPGVPLEDQIAEGELAMLILNERQELRRPGVEPMFHNPLDAEDEWFRRTGVIPINHVIAIRRRALDDHPYLVEQLWNVFETSKAAGLAALRGVDEPDPDEKGLLRIQALLGQDPLPFGIEENRAALEMVMRFAEEQRVLQGPRDLASVFAAT